MSKKPDLGSLVLLSVYRKLGLEGEEPALMDSKVDGIGDNVSLKVRNRCLELSSGSVT